MGYDFHVFRIKFDWLLQIPGSRSSRILEGARPILVGHKERDDYRPEDDDPDELPPEDALDQILEGRVPEQERGGEPYYLAVAAIYWKFAGHLDLINFGTGGIDTLTAVDAAFEKAGAPEPLRIVPLAFRGVPFRVPPGEDSPSLGFIEPADVRSAYRIFDGLSLLDMPSDVRGFAERFGIWLREASTRDQGLVGILA
jgi:hypothetical protein